MHPQRRLSQLRIHHDYNDRAVEYTFYRVSLLRMIIFVG
jgi:hypothetical protein